MSVAANDIQVIDSRYQPAANCIVCGNEIAAGGGVTARYMGSLVRFKCERCLIRFASNPETYLAGHASTCCHDHAASPASEWCD